jgi:glyoxylase-like metal-dependent hydrolase (beta-lactamase superfamily II)
MSNQPYHFDVGDFSCVAVCDADDMTSIGDMYPKVPKDELASAASALGYTVDAVPMSHTALVIRAGDGWVLVDAGLPQGDDEDHGHLLRDLQAERIAPEDIQSVIITHGHGDHVGGLVNANGKLNYPNARYFMWKSEWDQWMSDAALAAVDEARAAARRALYLPIRDKLTFVEAETDVVPGVRLVSMAGHTRGHCGVLVESNGERLLNLADMVHTPMQVRHPEWHCMYDTDPVQAVAARRTWFARAAQDNLLTMVFHLPFPGLGHIVPDGAAWTWQPI